MQVQCSKTVLLDFKDTLFVLEENLSYVWQSPSSLKINATKVLTKYASRILQDEADVEKCWELFRKFFLTAF